MTINWTFADGFDLYGATADCLTYWDSVQALTFVAGRHAGGQGLSMNAAGSGLGLTKASGSNDPVHHLAMSFLQGTINANPATSIYGSISIFDGATTQVCINFCQNGSITLTKAAFNGTVLATFVGAIGAINTWYGLEFELVIDPTVGSFKLRKNGNTADDFSATGLNTRNSANSYANKISILQPSTPSPQSLDDFVWQSGTATGAWLGDMQCFTKRPSSDQSVAWTPASPFEYTPYAYDGNVGGGHPANGWAYYVPFIPPCNGALNSAHVNISAAVTANLKCTLFNSSGGVPTTINASATTQAISGTGDKVVTFASPPSVTAGTLYYIGFAIDTSGGNITAPNNPGLGGNSFYAANAPTYAAFPVASPTGLSTAPAIWAAMTMTPSGVANAPLVGDNVPDGLNSYVQSSTVSQADFYGVSGVTTTGTIAFVVTKGLLARNDQGGRSGAVQNKSGSTVSQSPAVALSTSFQWAWRYDMNDPNTSASWTLTAANALQIGPVVTA